ncbi:hypothetical protein [Pectobacterium carotovorum]|uniref:hypothetical protein n=1 Tax=Pectobacterium carotovorum TaxID=554 RepID=UPI0005832E09|nr:hypothetical protein [Pectobacterium carotovorum]KHS85093.1 hypothetical protein RC84_06140 [Pectobacterium carotovorum subsp. carotovorum]
MREYNLKNIVINISIFLCSLDSFFRERGIVAIAFLLLLIVINKDFFNTIKTKYINYTFVFSFFYLFYSILAISFPGIYLQIPVDENNFAFKIIDRLSLLIIFLLISIVFEKISMENNLYLIVKIHMMFFYFQFLLWFLFDIKFDIIELLFGVAQRNEMGFGDNVVFRPAGLYIEPSNYAAYITCMFSPYIIKNNRFKFIDYLVPCSILLTLSSAAFFIGLLLFFVMLIKGGVFRKLKTVILLSFLVMPLVIFLGFKQIDRFGSDGVMNNSNTILRMNLINYVIDSRMESIGLTLIGTGLYSYDMEIYRLENASDGRAISSIQDASLFIYTFLITGVIGFLAIILLLLSTNGIANKLVVLSVFFSKISFLFPIFLFFLFFLLKNKKN